MIYFIYYLRQTLLFHFVPWKVVNPSTPRSDQYINSSKNFNTLLGKQVMRTKKIIKLGVLLGYNTKFSGQANKEMYGHQLGELAFRSWE